MHVLRGVPRVFMSALLGAALTLPVAGGPVVHLSPVLASHTSDPAAVSVPGTLNSELGCPDDWDPACPQAQMTRDANDGIWKATWTLPAASYAYKAAINGSWGENYGANAQQGGADISLVSDGAPITFFYDHLTHWITSTANTRIVTAPGSFQSELGCAGDWDPACMRSWLEDPDGDGTFSFSTTTLPVGDYHAKAAINRTWDENYGAGGAPNGADIPFSVAVGGSTVDFSFVSATNVLTVTVTPPSGHHADGNVEWDGLRHDSRDLLYRTPGGAVPAGTPVLMRFRTFHNDVTGVTLRRYSVNANGQQLIPMELAAAGVDCYQPGLEDETCDFWQAALTNAAPDNFWYRFIVSDGSDTDYYADDTGALDGGLGATTDDPVDNSYALMVHEPDFSTPSWASRAVIYQVFPDRFFNGSARNDPKSGDVRYDDPVLKLGWGVLPEGYCRNYADADGTTCPWRFDDTPPDWSPLKEGPRGRDYMGGDLAGLKAKLGHLKSLGVTAIYLNPIFDGGSNHGYDTQDYTRIDPYFGTQKDFDALVKQATSHGIRLILDGVFNHLSSDSPFFDRYGHYPAVGACESVDSPYRSWFYFHDVPAGNGSCVGSDGTANAATYDGWFGFDSIPVINKSVESVEEFFLTDSDSIARLWLQRGAGGWRMDVSGDPSFPNGYWETFRDAVKGQHPDALTISETWQKDSTLLRMLRGDRLDTTMNYRLRDAVLGLLAPHNFDSKGFADSGRPITPSEFAARMLSQREDYPDAAYYTLMNLLDSHDTERLLWTLTPGNETRAERELDATNLAEGKRRLQLASLIQFTVPGAPTVYYGDEVGMTGDDDPDDRRTFPWPETGGRPDNALKLHYQSLSGLRAASAALTAGDLRVLLADDGAGSVAYGRRTDGRAAIVVVNRSAEQQTLAVPVAGFVPDGVSFSQAYAVGFGAGAPITASEGVLDITLPALAGVLLDSGVVDLAPPAAPTLDGAAGNGQVELSWSAPAGATGYNLYRSPLSGGGFVKLNGGPLTDTSYTDTGLDNATTYYYVVTALDDAGNESGWSNETPVTPHLVIGWANLQWPPTLDHTISTTDRSDEVYGQVWIDGATDDPGPTPTLIAQAGFGPAGSDPAGNPDWTWNNAVFNVDVGNNDEFKATFLPDTLGTFHYVYRYSTTNGAEWLYADRDGPFNGTPPNPGVMTVIASSDTTAPAAPSGLHVVSASPAGIELAWDAIVGDSTLHGYEVRRSDTAGGPYTTLGLVNSTGYTDADVAEAASYYYVVRSVDTSFNRSAHSAEVEATAALRTVTLNFNVTVPASTDGTGASVHIAGFLDRLDGGLPQWDPGGVELTRVDATHWTIQLSGREGTQLEYKYTLGDWDHVEKGASCDEIGNRQLTLVYGAGGTQNVNDTVANWRNVAPCGN